MIIGATVDSTPLAVRTIPYTSDGYDQAEQATWLTGFYDLSQSTAGAHQIWISGIDGYDVVVHEMRVSGITSSTLGYQTIAARLSARPATDGTKLQDVAIPQASLDRRSTEVTPPIGFCYTNVQPTTFLARYGSGTISALRIMAQSNTAAALSFPAEVRFNWRTRGETRGILLRHSGECVTLSWSTGATENYSYEMFWSVRKR